MNGHPSLLCVRLFDNISETARKCVSTVGKESLCGRESRVVQLFSHCNASFIEIFILCRARKRRYREGNIDKALGLAILYETFS